MSTPAVPKRPSRSPGPAATATAAMDMPPPKVPARPGRRLETSPSPSRNAQVRSPLNDSPFAANTPGKDSSGFYMHGRNTSSSSFIQRPPSVSALPLIGQEGSEYASLEEHARAEAVMIDDVGHVAASPNHTSNVAGDLPLYAPRASISKGAAQSKIATVTRTDSERAASVEIAKAQNDQDELDRGMRPPSSRSGFQRPPSVSLTPRAESIHDSEHEHGIPEIGIRVPMYPNAGDVQAPSPAPSAAIHPAGIGFFNDGSRPTTQDGRRRSAQGFHGPPGSYGLHGHGLGPQDQFEKSWYQRHPNELEKEVHHTYNAERGEWALSSDDLNKIVRGTSRSASGMGVNEEYVSIPTEVVGYQASEQYARQKPSQDFQRSSLRKIESANDEGAGSDDVSVPASTRGTDKLKSGDYERADEQGLRKDEFGRWIDEHGEGTPIFASDELAKDPRAEYMHAAVTPEPQHIDDDSDSYAHGAHRSASRSRSRPSSRSGIGGLSRFTSHEHFEGTGTPLEEIEEYEPLFEEDEDGVETKRPLTAADRFKRPELARRFPSQDVWEDTPTSLQLQTEVEGPQEPEHYQYPTTRGPGAIGTFESPEQELKRKGEVTEDERIDRLTDPKKRFAKPKFNADVQEDTSTRPGLRHRFPSQDIWEDTPDSLSLTTTIEPAGSDASSPQSGNGSPKMAEGFSSIDSSLKAPAEKPAIPTRPSRTRAAENADGANVPPRPTQRSHQISPPNVSSVPAVPSDEKKAPLNPDRPKPQVPARPVKASSQEISAGAPLAKSISPDESVKPKPAVPSRPAGGSKIASLKAGFMSDLNSRLQLGPKPPVKPQPAAEDTKEEESAPLSDARKGRARGPARRKPADPSPQPEASSAARWSFSKPMTVWHVPDNGTGEPSLAAATVVAPTVNDVKEAPVASPLATNTAGESLQARSETPLTSSGALAHGADATMDRRAQADEAAQKQELESHTASFIGHVGDVPEVPVDSKPVLDVGPEATGPAPVASEHADAQMADSAVQTGERQVAAEVAGGDQAHQHKVTVVVGGVAQGDGDSTAVVQE